MDRRGQMGNGGYVPVNVLIKRFGILHNRFYDSGQANWMEWSVPLIILNIPTLDIEIENIITFFEAIICLYKLSFTTSHIARHCIDVSGSTGGNYCLPLSDNWRASWRVIGRSINLTLLPGAIITPCRAIAMWFLASPNGFSQQTMFLYTPLRRSINDFGRTLFHGSTSRTINANVWRAKWESRCRSMRWWQIGLAGSLKTHEWQGSPFNWATLYPKTWFVRSARKKAATVVPPSMTYMSHWLSKSR